HVEPRMHPAVLGRHHRLEEARLAQCLHPCAAGGIDVVMRQRGQGGVGPTRQRLRKTAMSIVEERPAQRLLEVHLSCPRIPASAWRRRRGTPAQNPPSPCTGPAPPPPLRSRSRPTSPIPSRACAWSFHWRR